LQRAEVTRTFETDFRYLRVAIGAPASPAPISALALSIQLLPSVKSSARMQLHF
jgi:hypothetical protein